jgi:hypothetical protein
MAALRTALARSVAAFYPVMDIVQLQHEVMYKSVPEYADMICEAQPLQPVSPLPNVDAMTAVLLIHGGLGDPSPLAQGDAMLGGRDTIGQKAALNMLDGAGHDFTPRQFDHAWPWVVTFLARHQMVSVAWRTPEQQKRVNLFTERGWSSRLGAPGNPVCGFPATGSPVSCFHIGIGAPSDESDRVFKS